MILTGKCLEDFNKWSEKVYDNNYNGTNGKRLFFIDNLDDYAFIKTENYIHNLGDSMLNSLIIEWFDSVGIYIIPQLWETTMKWNYRISDNHTSDFECTSRTEAINAAIKKANDIYNGI